MTSTKGAITKWAFQLVANGFWGGAGIFMTQWMFIYAESKSLLCNVS